jgi:hypothetical protein
MAKKSKQDTRMAERRKAVVRDYLMGMAQYDIAEKYGVVQSVISRDLSVIREQWMRSTLVDFNEAKAREVAKIDNIEMEWWSAWRRSIGEKTKARTRQIVGTTVHEVTIEKDQLLGNPTFLQGVQWCIEQRCKIFGIYEATKVAVVDWRKSVEEQGHDAGEIFERMVDAYRRATDPSAGGEDDSGSSGGSSEA